MFTRDNISVFEVINSVDSGYRSFYDTVEKEFLVSDEELLEPRYIKVPFASQARSAAWKLFYDSLDEDELAIANDYPYRRGFFDYMRETGLIVKFYDAEQTAITAMFESWVKKNNITVPCNIKF